MHMPFLERRAKYHRAVALWCGCFTALMGALGFTSIYENYKDREQGVGKAETTSHSRTTTHNAKSPEAAPSEKDKEESLLPIDDERLVVGMTFALGLATLSAWRRSRDLKDAARLLPALHNRVEECAEALNHARNAGATNREVGHRKTQLLLTIEELRRMKANVDAIVKEKSPTVESIMQGILAMKKAEESEPKDEDPSAPEKSLKDAHQGANLG